MRLSNTVMLLLLGSMIQHVQRRTLYNEHEPEGHWWEKVGTEVKSVKHPVKVKLKLVRT